jgi:uncharacterized membrane protein
MARLFRAEIQRANVWRQRLDTTTNWAVAANGTEGEDELALTRISFGRCRSRPISK